jgi:hypothetical protein
MSILTLIKNFIGKGGDLSRTIILEKYLLGFD